MNHKQTVKNKTCQENGYVTLLSTLILSVVALSISVTLLATGITTSQNSLTLTSNARAKAYAAACTEKALSNIRTSNLYTGTLNFTFTNGSCSAMTTDVSGGDKRVESTGISGNITQREELETKKLTSPIEIKFRRNVGDF